MYEEHREGQVTFLRPPLQKIPTTSMPVFYNPKSELNRDVTVVAVQAFLKAHEIRQATVCTPLAGTGVRALRLVKETKGIKRIIAGDVNPRAVELIRKNITLNEVEGRVEVHQKEANLLLTEHHSGKKKFDIVDIDPFGSPRNFLAAAIGALRAKALLCITATDMPVLVGIRRRACIKRYAAEPARTEYAHELAVRILLGCAVREAAAQDMGIRPLISFYADHYVRLICEALRGEEEAWKAISQLGYLVHCAVCGHRELIHNLTPKQPICSNCQDEKVQRAGPLWISSIADRDFLDAVLQLVPQHTLGTSKRLARLLHRLLEEVDGPPTYYNLHELSDKLQIPVPAFKEIISELQAKNYFCTRTHFSPYGIRTNASEKTISQVLTQHKLEDPK